MTMATVGTYTRMMRSAGAQALEDQLAAFATQWVMNWNSRVSVPAELAVFHKLMNAALARAADAWNQRHHALRKLPLEIFELCWSFLGTDDLLRVAASCKLYRRLIHDAPALWTDVAFKLRGSASHFKLLGPLLERSRSSIFNLSVELCHYSGSNDIAAVIRPHAHRLRRLELHPYFTCYDRPVQMRFSAPELRVFVSQVPGPFFDEGSFIFSCPNLERLQLVSLELDRGLPPGGFGRVTSLTFGWGGEALNRLYDAFPGLVSLDITRLPPTNYHPDIPDVFDLPRDRPPPATLQRVVLRGMGLSYDDLRAFGFTAVRELEIEGDEIGIYQSFDEALALFDALGGTPRSAALQGKRLVVHVDGPGPRDLCMTFDVDTRKPAHQYYTVLARPAVRANIRTLALSVEEPPRPHEAFRPHFLFPADEFPALDTLVLPVGLPLLDLDFMIAGGTLRAPALRRLAIVDTPRKCCDGAARSLKPLVLAVFIARHLALAPGRILDELVLDGDHGVVLCEGEDPYDDGLDILQSYVGTISHRYWPQGEY